MADVLYTDYDPDFGDCWRFFSQNYNGNPDSLEQNTSLQKNIVRYLKRGGMMGEGMCVIVFDGEKIISRRN